MIDDEHLLVTFIKHYNIGLPRILLVLFDSDATALYPKLKHMEFNNGLDDKNGLFWPICPICP